MSPKENVEVTDNNCKSTIDLVFKVFAPSLNRMIHRMYLLGSLQQMGAWNIQDAAQAFPTPDFHTWRVDIRNVPIHSSFEWSWVKARSNKTDVKWERMVKRNRTVDCFGGVIHTIYGDGEEVFVQSATYAEVGTYRKVDQGQYLALTGCSQTTGAWNIEKAVKATEYPRMSGYWRVQIAFDSNSSLQFKWAILNETNKQLHMIEKEDHFLYGRQTWMRVVAPWNVPRVFVEDTPICLEPMDHVMGRTDVLVNAKKAHTESIRQWLKTDSKTKSLALVSISNVRTPKPAQPPKNAPRKTNVEKAKEALKNFMALTVTESDSKLSGNSLGSASNRVPTVLPLENVDDHAKKRAENARLVLNKQQDNERKAFNSTIPIKGKGQTVMAKTSGQEGCDGDSAMVYETDRANSVIGISEPGKSEHVSEVSVEGLFDFHGQENPYIIEGFKPKEEHSLYADVDDDSGFDTVSQNENSSEITPCTDPYDLGSQSGLVEEKEMKRFVEDNFNGDFFSFYADRVCDFDNLGPKLESVQSESRINTPAFYYGVKDYSSTMMFEEDDYLDFLSSKVTDENDYAESFKFDSNVEIDYIMPEIFTPKMRVDKVQEKLKEFRRCKDKSLEEDFHKYLRGFRQKKEFDEIGEAENTRMAMRIEDTDILEMAEKRAIARMLEKHWGATGDHMKKSTTEQEKKDRELLEKLSLSSSSITFNPRPSTVSFDSGAGGVADLIPSSAGRVVVAQYSYTELANVTIPPSDNVNHRAVARRIEEIWGATRKSY